MHRWNHHIWGNRELSAAEKLVMLYLLERANKDGVCWPSLNTIARDTGLTRRGVIGILRRLRDAGYITWKQVGQTNTYRVAVDRLVNEVHQGSEPGSPGVVNQVHQVVNEVHQVVNEVHQVVNEVHQGSEPGSPGVVNAVHPNHPIELSTEPPIEPPIEPPNNNPPLYPPPNAAPQEPPSSPAAVAVGGEALQTQNPQTPKAAPNRESEVLALTQNLPAAGAGPVPTMTPDEARTALQERIPQRIPPPPQVPGEMVRELREAGLWERFSALRRYARDTRAWHEWLAGPVAAQWRRLGSGFAPALRGALEGMASRPDLARPLIWLERQLERATPPPPPPPPKTREEELVDQVVRAPTLEEAVDAFLEWAREVNANERPVA